jgi:hypothetical protein
MAGIGTDEEWGSAQADSGCSDVAAAVLFSQGCARTTRVCAVGEVGSRRWRERLWCTTRLLTGSLSEDAALRARMCQSLWACVEGPCTDAWIFRSSWRPGRGGQSSTPNSTGPFRFRSRVNFEWYVFTTIPYLVNSILQLFRPYHPPNPRPIVIQPLHQSTHARY